MKKTLVLLAVLAASACAQVVETIPFRAIMSPRNENPPIDIAASGSATILAHVIRDASGNVTSGSVDFRVYYNFPGDVTFTGLHIHNGAAGVNGPVVIGTNLGSGANSVNDPTGRGTVVRQVQVLSGTALDSLKGMLENPAGYYVNLHTTVNPGGVIRGQLVRAESILSMALMSPDNEVPPIPGIAASAVGLFRVFMTRDASGAIDSAEASFDVNYSFPSAVTFTGLHIHTGAEGTNGPVTIPSALTRADSATSGVGTLSYTGELVVTNAATAAALNGLVYNPSNYYMNLHTSVNTGGVVRGQVRNPDWTTFGVKLLPQNEVPAITGLAADASGALTAYALRAPDGNVQAGTVIFDINPRFPGAVEFTGLHIHDGKAGANGPVTIGTSLSGTNSVLVPTGTANIYLPVLVTAGTPLATLNSLLQNPENHYVNLHTRDNPGGVVRTQLAAANTALPAIGNVISAVSEPTLTNIAPGGLMTIFGTNLTKVAADLSGWAGSRVPNSLNGTSVTIGGLQAPVLWVNPGFIVAQVPFEAPVATHPVVVKNSNGESSAFKVVVADKAPGLFFDAQGGLILKNNDFSLVSAQNPARAGDIVLLFSTGLGGSRIPVGTGAVIPDSPFFNTEPVTVSIGGVDAPVTYSLFAPGFTGLYQTAVRVPAVTGNLPVVLTIGGVKSNTVSMTVR